MAKKKDVKPLLDEFIQAGINLLQAVETACELDQVSGAAKGILKERADAFRKAFLSDV